jgi:hypothetical protein
MKGDKMKEEWIRDACNMHEREREVYKIRSKNWIIKLLKRRENSI